MFKTAHIVSLFMGQRRTINNNPQGGPECLKNFQELVELAKVIDPGVPMDVIVVNQQAGFHEGNVYLDTVVNGSPTKTGKFICYTRENLGASFAAYNYGWQFHKKDYQYFMFGEDDVHIIENNVMFDAMRHSQSSSKIGFVSLSPISVTYPIHAGGGFGVTSMEKLLEAAESCGGSLPHNLGKTYGEFEGAEVAFTSVYPRLGYRIENVPGYNPLASNFMKHFSQPRYAHLNSGKYIYKVGVA